MPLNNTDKTALPSHVAFIMDGNGRWAKKRNLPRTAGHKQGVESLKKIMSHCRKLHIPYATFYAFSTENWNRPKEEVDALMDLFRSFTKEIKSKSPDGTRIIFLGDKTPFSPDLRESMLEIEEATKNQADFTAAFAMNYGGRDEILKAVRALAVKCLDGDFKPEDISEEDFSNSLYTAGIPDPDLIIRPSGEQRLSNFLPWQSVYSELYFTNILWPDFSPVDLDAALDDFTHRSRRFGGV